MWLHAIAGHVCLRERDRRQELLGEEGRCDPEDPAHGTLALHPDARYARCAHAPGGHRGGSAALGGQIVNLAPGLCEQVVTAETIDLVENRRGWATWTCSVGTPLPRHA